MLVCVFIVVNEWSGMMIKTEAFSVRNPMGSIPTKYIQGIHYSNGDLFFGTDNGNICCLSRNSNADLSRKWVQTVSTRNVQRIDGNRDNLLITCDSERGEAGRSVICDIQSGKHVDTHIWQDTTVYETLTDDNEWMRLNSYGELMTKVLHRDNEFTVKYRIPISSLDFVSCAKIHKKRLYAVTLSGKLCVIHLEKLEIETWQKLNIVIPTCIHVANPSNSDALFMFIANLEGSVHFSQMINGKITSYTEKHVHNSVATQIGSNYQGVYISFEDSYIAGFEILSFREMFSFKTHNPSYKNVDSFCLSPRGLFYVDNVNNEIRMETRQSMKLSS